MKNVHRTLAVAAMSLSLFLPDPAAAGKQPFSAPDPALTRPRREAPVPSQAVRLQGEIAHARRGYSIEGQRLIFTERTGFFPGISDRSRAMDPKSLRGKTATVYGRTTPRGIEVSLVIVSNDPTTGSTGIDVMPKGTRPDPSTYQLPSDADATVGELTEAVPR